MIAPMINLTHKNKLRADYVIVGAGSAGCVLARRLCEDPNVSVILVEAGGSHHPWYVRMPSAFYIPMNRRRFNWKYVSEPQSTMNQRTLDCPRGRGLGGSSAINGMVYVRGNKEDYNRWHTAGADGWHYDAVLPYFRKAQHHTGTDTPHPYHGHNGPLTTRVGDMENPLYQTFLTAAEQAGHTLRNDLNGDHQEGFGALPMTVENGQRASVARAYLGTRPTNLTVLDHAQVLKVNMAKKRALGISIKHRGTIKQIEGGEVILSAGAIGSPHLLMLSGIGPGTELSKHKIQVSQDLPGVGQNLMDHLEVYVQQACRKPISLYKDLGLLGRAMIGVQWLTTQTGLGATNHFEAGGFIKSESNKTYPDIQFHFLPAAMSYDGSSKARGHGYQAHVGPMLSPSRGTITLRTNNPMDHPKIDFNYMSHSEDWQVFRAAIRAADNIFSQSAFDDVRGPMLNPTCDLESDAAIDDFVRNHAESAYHPCGTCRMGNDSHSVVNSEGKVLGIDGLRVVDASIFPHITNGNLNAPTIMVAERMADIIRGRETLG